MKPLDFDKWSKKKAEQIKQMLARVNQLQAHPPSGNLLDELEFIEDVEFVFKKIDASDSSREIILEAWLLIDYIVTYLLRDGLQIPERIEDELRLLPFSFETKLDLIKNSERLKRKNFRIQRVTRPTNCIQTFLVS